MILSLTTMGWRNLWRRKRRTAITAGSIAFGLFFSVTFTAIGDHTYTKMIDTSAIAGYGHITIEPIGYNDSPGTDKRIANVNEILSRAKRLPVVTSASAKIMGPALFSLGGKNAAGVLMAIDARAETPQNNLFVRSLKEGALFTGPEGRGALIGSALAKKLHLKIGKRFVYTTTDKNGEMVSEAMQITGIFQTGADGADSRIVLLPIDTVRNTLLYDKDAASIISIFVNDQRQAKSIRQKIREAAGNPNIEMLTWNETQADIAGFVAVDRAMNHLFQFLVGLMTTAGILNTMMMSVLERRREFGVMMAIGTSPRKLFLLIMVESFWLYLTGLGLGVFITAPWFYYMSHVGIDLSRFLTDGMDIGGVFVDPVLRFRLFKESVFAILSGLFLFTMAAGIYPAWKASRWSLSSN